MRIVPLGCVSALALVFWAAPVVAEEEPDFFHTGLYVGADAVLAVDNFREQTAASRSKVGAGAIRVGYRLNPFFSVEAGATATDDFGLTVGSLSGLVRIWQVTGNIKANADLRWISESLGRVQPYGILGIGYYRAWGHQGTFQGVPVPNDSIGDGMARIGVGVDVYITEQLLVAAEGRYNALFSRRLGLDFWAFSLGPQFRF